MADTKIEWAQKVWNPVTGCSKVSQGCKNCYAEVMHKRLMKMQPDKYNRPFLDGASPHEPSLEIPLHWKKPQRIFVNSMSDLFHEDVPHDFILRVLMVIRECPQHIFQILTKRPKRAKEFFNGFLIASQKLSRDIRGEFPFPNLWLGVSVEDQATADERIPLLLQTPAAIRFLSVEPMLQSIELKFIGCPECGHSENYWFPNFTICHHCHKEVKSPPDNIINWVICGGESGKNARPMNPDWVRSLRDQCKEANVPFFFKQWGEWLHENLLKPEVFLELMSHRTAKKYKQQSISNGVYLDNYVWLGKKKAGKLLDGVEHNEFPKGIK